MKTAFYLILTCFISTGCFLSALGSKTPLLLYAIGFGVWALFILGALRRSKKRAERRDMEQSFRDFMRKTGR